MLGILNDVDSPYYQNYTLYEHIGEEFDVLHDGNRIMDISFLESTHISDLTRSYHLVR